MHQQLQLLSQEPPRKREPRFDGNDSETKLERRRVWEYIKDGKWFTLYELQKHISQVHGKWYSDSSLSARVRDFRKAKFGGHDIKKRIKWPYIGPNHPTCPPQPRTYEYRLVLP